MKIHFGEDVIFTRKVDGEIETNILHDLVVYNSTGFEWGYIGSGPTEFALNILWAFTQDIPLSLKLHQDFKYFFIAGAPNKGGVIKNEDIKGWIIDNLIINGED